MKIKVPDSWNEVSVRQFMEISSVDSKDRALQIISILLDKDPEEIRRWDGASIGRVTNCLEWAMKHPPETYNTQIEVDGVEYHMIENLNGFSGGEWWDMEEYLNDFNSNLHYLFAMFYRPIGESYDPAVCKRRGEIFLDKLMIGQVYGSLLFFSHVGARSMKTIVDYLANQQTKNSEEKQSKKKTKDLKKKKKNELE